MSDNPVSRYLDAVKQYEQAQREVQRLTEVVTRAATGLQDPMDFTVSNVPVSFTVGAAKHILNANTWPSAQQLAEAVSKMQEWDFQVTAALHAIPEEDRRRLSL